MESILTEKKAELLIVKVISDTYLWDKSRKRFDDASNLEHHFFDSRYLNLIRAFVLLSPRDRVGGDDEQQMKILSELREELKEGHLADITSKILYRVYILKHGEVLVHLLVNCQNLVNLIDFTTSIDRVVDRNNYKKNTFISTNSSAFFDWKIENYTFSQDTDKSEGKFDRDDIGKPNNEVEKSTFSFKPYDTLFDKTKALGKGDLEFIGVNNEVFQHEGNFSKLMKFLLERRYFNVADTVSVIYRFTGKYLPKKDNIFRDPIKWNGPTKDLYFICHALYGDGIKKEKILKCFCVDDINKLALKWGASKELKNKLKDLGYIDKPKRSIIK